MTARRLAYLIAEAVAVAGFLYLVFGLTAGAALLGVLR